MPDLDAAERFLAAHGRVLDRRRFERQFRGGDAGPVRDAVAAYQNADGGFGHGLEPDGRGPGSQPAAMQLALRVLDEADAWDDALIDRALGWLDGHEGALPFVDPNIEGWPAAPWWQPQDGLPPSLVSTGPVVATLRKRGVAHPWIDRASAWLHEAAPKATTPYDLLGAVAYTAQAEPEALAALDPAVRAITTDDPDAPGETFSPLLFAPLFSDAELEPHLDHLEAAQRPDGGSTFNWPAWSPAAEADWRGALTVDALVTLSRR